MDVDKKIFFETYPRMSAPLTGSYAHIYADQYKSNREGDEIASGLAQKLERWMHRKVASIHGGPVLELGAGTLNHLSHETTIHGYDIVEPFKYLFEGKYELDDIRHVFDSQLDIEDETYKRITSIAVLEHLSDLPKELAKSATLLEEDGVFQAGIPSEGGFLWWLGWRCSTGFSFWLKHKLDYGVIMKHEHVSKAREIVHAVKFFFEDVKVKKWPLPFDNLSFYQYIEARNPKREFAQRYLEGARYG